MESSTGEFTSFLEKKRFNNYFATPLLRAVREGDEDKLDALTERLRVRLRGAKSRGGDSTDDLD